MNTLYYIPNAILLKESTTQEEYFFGSFIDRDVCFKLLTSLAAVAKSLETMSAESMNTTTNNNINNPTGNLVNNHSITTSGIRGISKSTDYTMDTSTMNATNIKDKYIKLKFGIQKDGVSDIISDLATLTQSAVAATTTPAKNINNATATSVGIHTTGSNLNSENLSADNLTLFTNAIVGQGNNKSITNSRCTSPDIINTANSNNNNRGITATNINKNLTRSPSPGFLTSTSTADPLLGSPQPPLKPPKLPTVVNDVILESTKSITHYPSTNTSNSNNNNNNHIVKKDSFSTIQSHNNTHNHSHNSSYAEVVKNMKTGPNKPKKRPIRIRKPHSTSNPNLSTQKPSFDFHQECQKKNIQILYTENVPLDVDDIWSYMWKNKDGFNGFLTNMGDFDINGDDWQPLHGTKKAPNEEFCKFPFTHYRICNYLHPRTTHLYIGPKNAPATQTHYLYTDMNLSSRSNSSAVNDDDNTNIETYGNYGLVLTVTQFDGIPMADCFKIFQYYYFEHKDSHNSNNIDFHNSNISTNITVGLYIHFIKQTMFKGQVNSGVKEEVTDVAKRWVKYTVDKIKTIMSENDWKDDSGGHLSTPSPRSRTTSMQQQPLLVGSGGLVANTTNIDSTNILHHVETANGTKSSSSVIMSHSNVQYNNDNNRQVFLVAIILLLLVFIVMQYCSQIVLMKELAYISKKLNSLEALISKKL